MILGGAICVMPPGVATPTSSPPGPPDSRTALKVSAAVFVGRVTGIKNTGPEMVEVTFAIEKAWKGVAARTMMLSMWTPGNFVPRARRVLVYAGEDPPRTHDSAGRPLEPRPRLYARPAFESAADIAALGPPAITFEASPASFKGTVTAVRDAHAIDVRPDGEERVVTVKLEGFTFEGSTWSPVEGLAFFTMGKHVLVDPILSVAAAGPVAADIYLIDVPDPVGGRISFVWDLLYSRAARWDRVAAPHDAVLPWWEEFARRRFGER